VARETDVDMSSADNSNATAQFLLSVTWCSKTTFRYSRRSL